MYSYIIKLAHGFTLIPTILAFKNKKIFKILKHPRSLNKLLSTTKFNPGYLIAGLNLLTVFSIIKRKGDIFFYKKEHPLVNIVNKNFLYFYNYHNNRWISTHRINLFMAWYGTAYS